MLRTGTGQWGAAEHLHAGRFEKAQDSAFTPNGK